ncbi:hypothetical protein [Alloacidobacterium sp.]|uniref:hypothetical protein n=1 Tax=Alloacidobacterium sp. TaxID=2951999 RepID=UPI002D221A17|nr:hypothetical protein [Alloacidobacterium sp.]HYK36895.1 hypothetical protein [Alloacidobacterium sp.]
MTAIHSLLAGVIDYAGLFPPASLDMQTSVRNYSAYRASDEAWMLGRFIVPAQRLVEFSAAFSETCCDEQMSPWLLSVLSTGDANEDARFIEAFNEGAAFLDAIELKTADVVQAERQLRLVPSGMAAYVEFPLGLSDGIFPVLKQFEARAKIRTGGITADAIPEAQKVTKFLVACAKARVSFKATAGLHHPLRSAQKLTYEENSATAIMHGFINLFVAAMVAYRGAAVEEVMEAITEESPGAFQWKKNTLIWRNHRFSEKQIKETRENFAIGFGSCSFIEPVHDLKALRWR